MDSDERAKRLRRSLRQSRTNQCQTIIYTSTRTTGAAQETFRDTVEIIAFQPGPSGGRLRDLRAALNQEEIPVRLQATDR